MKKFAKLTAIILLICILASSFVFAATPKASIVSPAQNNVIADDNLLITVKVLDKKKICVRVFEEKVLVGTKEVDGKETEILKSIDVSDFTTEILEVLSKEYEKNKSLELGDDDEKQVIRDVLLGDPVSYTATGEVSCFTKKLEDVKPGLYRIKVQVLGKEDKVEETYNSFVAVQEKLDNEKEKEKKNVPVESIKLSLVKFFAKLLKSLIK